MEKTFQKLPFRWIVLGISWIAWLLQGTGIFSIGPMLTILIPKLGLSGFQAGLLMSLSWIGQIIFALPIGLLTDRIGGRKLGALGVFLLGVGFLGFSYWRTFLF